MRKFIMTIRVFALCSVSSIAFAQGSMVPNPGPGGFNSNGTISLSPGTTQLVTGISYGTNNSITGSETFAKDFDQYSFHPIVSSGRMFAYGTQYNIKGTRFLFDDWVKGTVVKNSGEEITGTQYFFNFDKINNNLLVTIDKMAIIEVYKDSIQSFHFSEKGKEYNFEKVTPIHKYRFSQVLVKNSAGYSLYKSISTKFVQADFNTNGLTQSGNPYDEFVDVNQYYIMYKGELRPVQLKFTSIKRALKENSSRVKDYYADHLMDDVDEDYLVNIVNSVN